MNREGAAIAAFLRDLIDGDPVALMFAALFLAFLFVLGVAGFFIVLSRKRQQEAHRRKLKLLRDRPEKNNYDRMKDANL